MGLPILPLTQEVSCRVDVFDPKGEVAPDIIENTEARVFIHDNAEDAAVEGFESGENGIIILEELLSVPKKDYEGIRRVAAIRRRSSAGEGPVIFATTQRPKIMPVEIRSIADLWIVGSITDPGDLKEIEKVAGHEFTSELGSLQIGEFLAYSFGKDLTI